MLPLASERVGLARLYTLSRFHYAWGGDRGVGRTGGELREGKRRGKRERIRRDFKREKERGKERK